MYGEIEGLCWTEATADVDAHTKKIDLDWRESDPLPIELEQFFGRRSQTLEDYGHRWVGVRRLLLLDQELVVASDGRLVPSASVVEVFRMQSADGEINWTDGDAASVGLCSEHTAVVVSGEVDPMPSNGRQHADTGTCDDTVGRLA